MTERKEHEIGGKDQQLYSNLSIKCAGSAERRQCFIFNLLLCSLHFNGSKTTYEEGLGKRGKNSNEFFFKTPEQNKRLMRLRIISEWRTNEERILDISWSSMVNGGERQRKEELILMQAVATNTSLKHIQFHWCENLHMKEQAKKSLSGNRVQNAKCYTE